MDVRHEKSALRKLIIKQNSELSSEYILSADKAIAEHILSLPEYAKADTVFVFVSLPSEINTLPILTDALRSGKRLAVPRVEGGGKMELKLIDSLSELSPGAYGIFEPPRSAEAIAPAEIDFAVIPCVTCTRFGDRLGRGGGYYDRFLAQCQSPCALLCREESISAAVPLEKHDIPVRTVVTECGVFRNGF